MRVYCKTREKEPGGKELGEKGTGRKGHQRKMWSERNENLSARRERT
jgi:hypothetical protein